MIKFTNKEFQNIMAYNYIWQTQLWDECIGIFCNYLRTSHRNLFSYLMRCRPILNRNIKYIYITLYSFWYIPIILSTTYHTKKISPKPSNLMPKMQDRGVTVTLTSDMLHVFVTPLVKNTCIDKVIFNSIFICIFKIFFPYLLDISPIK